MGKVGVLIATLLAFFGLSSCTSHTTYTSNEISDDALSNNDVSDVDIIEGGPNSKVVGTYFFESFNEYFGFYSVFKTNNYQRYWTPVDSDKFNVTYCFKSEGINLEDVNNKRYDLVFPRQRMTVEMHSDEFSIDLNLHNINEFADKVNALNLSFSGEWDRLQATNVSNLQLMCSDLVIGIGEIVINTSTISSVYDSLDEILLLFEKGSEYVF